LTASSQASTSPESTAAVASAASKPRLGWVDAARGIGIILVVVGHVLRGLVKSTVMSESPAVVATDRWIYAFHMPLFFLLSGLFLAGKVDRPYATYAKDKLRRLAYPYVVWVLIQTSIQIVLSSHTNGMASVSDLINSTYRPPMQFWFLYVLTIQSLLFGLLWKFGARHTGFLVIACVAWFAVPLFPLSLLPLAQTCENLIYLALGVILGRRENLLRLARIPSGIAIATLVAGSLIVALAVWGGWASVRLTRPVVALSGVAAMLGLSLLLDRKNQGWIRFIGEASLAIYCAHTIFSAGVRIAIDKVFHIQSSAIHLVAGVVIGLYGPVLLFVLANRTGLPLFEWRWRAKRRQDVQPISTSSRLPS
jgi:fucose 4-O-acetylase-like acetyltransferase